jgi:hypothetical protein
MATIDPSGSRRTAQLPPEAPPPAAAGDLPLLETMASLNRGFEQVLADLKRLKQFGILGPQASRYFLKICSLTIEEMRAWANFELAEAVHDRAERDWAHFGRLRLLAEKRLRDPNDVLIEAERLQQKRQRATARKRAKKPR